MLVSYLVSEVPTVSNHISEVNATDRATDRTATDRVASPWGEISRSLALIKVKFVVYKLQHYMHGCHTDLGHSAEPVRPHTHGNVFLRFCIVYCSQGN